MPRPNDAARTREVGDAIAQHLAEISMYFKPVMKLSLLAREPDYPDGSRNILVSDDEIDDMIAALERLRTPAHIFEHRV